MRKWWVILSLATVVVVSAVLFVWLWRAGRTVPSPVYLHYSVELGVDDVGSRWGLLGLPVALLAAGFLNLIGANFLLLRERMLAPVMAMSNLPLVLLAIWFSYLLLRVNGA